MTSGELPAVSDVFPLLRAILERFGEDGGPGSKCSPKKRWGCACLSLRQAQLATSCAAGLLSGCGFAAFEHQVRWFYVRTCARLERNCFVVLYRIARSVLFGSGVRLGASEQPCDRLHGFALLFGCYRVCTGLYFPVPSL